MLNKNQEKLIEIDDNYDSLLDYFNKVNSINLIERKVKRVVLEDKVEDLKIILDKINSNFKVQIIKDHLDYCKFLDKWQLKAFLIINKHIAMQILNDNENEIIEKILEESGLDKSCHTKTHKGIVKRIAKEIFALDLKINEVEKETDLDYKGQMIENGKLILNFGNQKFLNLKELEEKIVPF